MILFVAIAFAAPGCGPASGPGSDDIAEKACAPAPYRIVYNVLHDEEVDDYDVFVMELDGTGKRNLTEHPAVDWVYSARGDRMFMVSDRDDEKRKYHLYEMGADGSDLEQITGDVGDECRHAWSPDGRYLAYDRAGEDRNYEIYLRDTETGETTRLTESPTYEQGPVFVSVIN